jgi:electron transfer flavoprotein alpha subunit
MDNPWLAWAMTQESQMTVSGTLNTGNEYRNIWVYAELQGGFIASETRQVFNKARELGDLLGARVQSVLFGGEESHAKDLIAYGADTVLWAQHPLLGGQGLELATKALGQLVATYKPEILLFGGSRLAEDLAPQLAARLETGFIADAIDLELDDAERLLRVTRSTFGGKLQTVSVIAERKPQVALVRGGSFREADFDRSRAGEIVKVDLDLNEADVRARVLESRPREGVNLENARIVVCGGKGVGKENWALVEQLAEALGGEVAGTKGAVAAGCVDASRQVGLAGKKVKPDLYVGVGLSGSLDHQGGMAGARTIVAVNTDREAPLMALADYALVGDLKDILPGWVKTLRERQGKRETAATR